MQMVLYNVTAIAHDGSVFATADGLSRAHALKTETMYLAMDSVRTVFIKTKTTTTKDRN